MRLPRVRFTVRWLMIVVAVAGIESFLIVSVARGVSRKPTAHDWLAISAILALSQLGLGIPIGVVLSRRSAVPLKPLAREMEPYLSRGFGHDPLHP